MSLDHYGRKKFYAEIKKGNIKQPNQISEKDVFWYESYVKQKVEEFKQESDIIACTWQAFFILCCN
jgi:predicted DNA-binding transcriptional regulator AlpA